ncbi:MAG: triose-phosphate isomerase [Gammaproteobacteria bacterium]
MLLKAKGVFGGLVGGASLKAEEFATMCRNLV